MSASVSVIDRLKDLHDVDWVTVSGAAVFLAYDTGTNKIKGAAVDLSPYATIIDLASETTVRIAADNTLQSNIAAEVTARANADALLAPLASPAFSGNPTAPTQLNSDVSTRLATTAFVDSRITSLINLAPTALDTLGEIATQLANDESAASALTTTVAGKLAIANNLSDLNNAGTAISNLFGTRAANLVFASPTTGSAAVPTFRSLVVADIPTLTSAKISDFTPTASAAAPVQTVAGRIGAVTLAVADISGFNTAVDARISYPVTTVAGRTGAVTLANTDISGLGTMAVQAESGYALLAGRAGGQTLNGGTAASENLTLNSTSHATKGKIFLGASSAYDGALIALGIGTTTPTSFKLQVAGNIGADADNTYNLGSVSLRFASIYGLTLDSGANSLSINAGTDNTKSVIIKAGNTEQLRVISGGVGINKSSSIGAQLHVVAKDLSSKGIRVGMAASPSATSYPFSIADSTDATLAYYDTAGNQLAPDGSTSNAAYGFASAVNSGMMVGAGGAGRLSLLAGGTTVLYLDHSNTIVRLGSAFAFGWTNGGAASSSTDLTLFRDAADTLALRRGTNAQTLRLYATYTDASNYERLSTFYDGVSDFRIASEGSGTGSINRSIAIGSWNASAGTNVKFVTRGSTRWTIDQNPGHLFPGSANGQDLGTASNTLRSGYFATSLIVGGGQAVGGVPLTVKGVASQSGNLQEWQDSTTAVKASIGASGALVAVSGTFSGALESRSNGTLGLRVLNSGGSGNLFYVNNAGSVAIGSGAQYLLTNSSNADPAAADTGLRRVAAGVIGASDSGANVNGKFDAAEYRVSGNKIIGSRTAGWTAPTSTKTRTNADYSALSLSQLAEVVAALVNDLHSAGTSSNNGILGT